MFISFGTYPRVLSRHDLTQVLYRSLPDSSREKIHSNKKVADIVETESGVEVSCTDGSVYQGTIVVGADGVHSMVRRKMRDLALSKDTQLANEEKPFLTTFKCLWIRFPTPLGMSAGECSETHGPMASTQLFTGEESAVAGVYVRLEEPKRDSARYGESDEAEVLNRWAHLPISANGDLTLGDVYKNRLQSGLVDLEEGVLENWHFDGRLVLVGDSCHKFTRKSLSTD